MNNKEIENVIKQEAPKRYKYFIGKVADTGKLWGLYDGGWALAGDENNTPLLALWPASEYAQLCAQGVWENHKPIEIEIHEFLDDYIKELENNHIGLAIFYTPADKGIVPSYEDFSNDLKKELSRIE